ncbi:MAG: hypothetical protein IJK58_00405 [Clostridia bacterium]|nr:hypothetical protein [Clostridia bacterium]
MGDEHRYDDIIDLPHHVSAKRKKMDPLSRAAQFSPFAALTGFDDYIFEEGRFTDGKAELDDDEKAAIGSRLSALAGLYPDAGDVIVTYWSEDRKKIGGKYLTVSGKVKKIDPEKGTVTFEGGITLPVCDVFSVCDYGNCSGEE